MNILLQHPSFGILKVDFDVVAGMWFGYRRVGIILSRLLEVSFAHIEILLGFACLSADSAHLACIATHFIFALTPFLSYFLEQAVFWIQQCILIVQDHKSFHHTELGNVVADVYQQQQRSSEQVDVVILDYRYYSNENVQSREDQQLSNDVHHPPCNPVSKRILPCVKAQINQARQVYSIQYVDQIHGLPNSDEEPNEQQPVVTRELKPLFPDVVSGALSVPDVEQLGDWEGQAKQDKYDRTRQTVFFADDSEPQEVHGIIADGQIHPSEDSLEEVVERQVSVLQVSAPLLDGDNRPHGEQEQDQAASKRYLKSSSAYQISFDTELEEGDRESHATPFQLGRENLLYVLGSAPQCQREDEQNLQKVQESQVGLEQKHSQNHEQDPHNRVHYPEDLRNLCPKQRHHFLIHFPTPDIYKFPFPYKLSNKMQQYRLTFQNPKMTAQGTVMRHILVATVPFQYKQYYLETILSRLEKSIGTSPAVILAQAVQWGHEG